LLFLKTSFCNFIAGVSRSTVPTWLVWNLKRWIILLLSIICGNQNVWQCSKQHPLSIILPWKLIHIAGETPWPQCRWWRSSC
jgi:hypothetical protein